MDKMTIDEAIKHTREVAERNRILANSDMLVQKSYDVKLNTLKCNKCADEHEQLAKWLEELKAYKDAEEQGFLKILPVDIGSDVYFIPSKVNYELNVLNHHEENNRVYHQKVANIVFNDRGYYLECDKDLEYGTDHVLVDIFYQVTWFTTEEEAEQALAEMKEGAV